DDAMRAPWFVMRPRLDFVPMDAIDTARTASQPGHRPALRHAVLAFALVLAPLPSLARDVFITVSGIANADGQVRCVLYDDGKGFPQEDKGVVDTVQLPAVEGLLTCIFRDVAPGRYAVSVVH